MPYDVMEELIRDLWTEGGDAFAPIEHEDVDYDDELSFLVVNRDDPLRFLQDRSAQIDAVLAVQAPANEAKLIQQMAHSSLFSALEAYMVDTVSYWVEHDPAALRRSVSRNRFQRSSLKDCVQNPVQSPMV